MWSSREARAVAAEKVNNLRVAVEQLPREFEVLVFADSDGRPGKSWLQSHGWLRWET